MSYLCHKCLLYFKEIQLDGVLNSIIIDFTTCWKVPIRFLHTSLALWKQHNAGVYTVSLCKITTCCSSKQLFTGWLPLNGRPLENKRSAN